MKYAIVFTLFGCYLLLLAVYLGDWAWLLLWPTANALLLAAAYAGLGPALFGKRHDGRRAWWATVVFLPYLTLTLTVWHLMRRFSKADVRNEVAPGLWVGRRPLSRDLPPNVGLVVDLTAELPVARGVALGREYVCLPTLDDTAPAELALNELMARIAACPGAIYIHCAAGHGRSATVAAVVLFARGLANSAQEAASLMRRSRPGVRFRPAQRRLLERLSAARDRSERGVP